MMAEKINMHEWGLEELPTTPMLPPKFINKPGSSFLALVLMRDDRDPLRVHYFHLSAVEPVECLNERDDIVAVGPNEIFSCEGYDLNAYFGLCISLEVTEKGATITVNKHETPTEPPPSTERSRP